MKTDTQVERTLPIWLIVGFLGAGKTTLLRRLVKSTHGQEYIYVVNEFSAVDVDAAQIERAGGVALVVAGGSIFCRCLITEFVSVMRRIKDGFHVGERIVRPQGVVIEASGMADPRSMRKLLAESHLDEFFHVAGVTAVVDPGVLMKLLLVLPNIKGQIQVADLIIFNKIDLRSPEMIERVREKVRAINPHGEIIESVQCDVEPELILRDGNSEAVKSVDAEYNRCKDPHYLNETIRFDKQIALRDLEDILPAKIDGLYRVKGYIETVEAGWIIVDWSEGGLTYQPAQPHSASALTVIWSAAADPVVIGELRYLAL
ncbi:MAG: GTP-binding protein [Kiritimatiellae bacterium]|nr:GTP-binding protein [Kiritimatiellia bacterium]